MGGVYEIIKQAGRIPLDELVVRSSDNPADVAEAVKSLAKQGLVNVHGQPLPQSGYAADAAAETTIEISKLVV